MLLDRLPALCGLAAGRIEPYRLDALPVHVIIRSKYIIPIGALYDLILVK